MFPTATYVKALDGKTIEVQFDNGDKRRFSLDQMLGIHPCFEELKDENLFEKVYIDFDGHGLIWTPDIDLASSAVWLKGTPVD